MAVTNVNPASGQTLTWNASFSFDVPDGLSSYLVRVTADGGVLESVYDSGAGGAANGYSVQVEDLGATLRFTVTRDAGWTDDPMTVHVTEDTTTTTWTYDIFPTATYPEGFRPYNDQAQGAVTGVLTFEGRDGNVVSAAGDYDSDEVTNASAVAGATVSDALETLDGKVTGVSSVFGRSGAVVAAASDYDASQVDNDSTVTGATVKDALESLDAGLDSLTEDKVALNNQVGTPTVTTQEDLNSVTGNVSRVNGGGVISDDGDGTVTVSAGSGFIRATDQNDAVLHKVTWAATPLTPTDNALSFIYYEWNGGTPQMVITTTKRTDLNTNIFIGTVQRTGTFLHPTTHVTPSGNVSTKLTKRFNDTEGLTRASGSVTSEVGTRNIAITAGTWWHGLDEVSTPAEDTSVPSETITFFYRDGVGGWTVVGGNTQIPNEYYDDGSGTLALLSANRYGVYWVYIGVDEHIYMVYGRGDYTSSQWAAAQPPGDLPPHMQEQHSGLVARIVVQKGASVFTDVSTPWNVDFNATGVSDHGDLAGLSDDDHPAYVLAEPSATDNALVVWDGTTGRNIKDTGDLYYASGALNLTNATSAGLKMADRGTIPGAAAGTGVYWVSDATPTDPVFTGSDGRKRQLDTAFGGLGTWFYTASNPPTTQGQVYMNTAAPSTTTTIRFFHDNEAGARIRNAMGKVPRGSSLLFRAHDDYANYKTYTVTDVSQDATTITYTVTVSNYVGTDTWSSADEWNVNVLPGVETPHAIRKVYDSSTADSDPGGPGNVRFNNANPALATEIYVDNQDADGMGDAALTGYLQSGTSVIFYREGKPDQHLRARIHRTENNLGFYHTLYTSSVVTSTNWTTPANGENIYMQFQGPSIEARYHAMFKQTGSDYPVGIAAADYGSLYFYDSDPTRLVVHDLGTATHKNVLQNNDTAVTDKELAYFDGTTGAFVRGSDGLTYDAGWLKMDATNAVFLQQERSTAPAHIAAKGLWWTKNDTPNRAMFTDDAGNDNKLAYVSELTSGSGDQDLRLEYDSGTAQGTGGVGTIRFNNATVTSATEAYIDDQNENSMGWRDLWMLQPGTHVVLAKATDATQQIRVNMIHSQDLSTYTKHTIASIAASTNWTNPTDGDALVVLGFAPSYTGGTGGNVALVMEERATAPDTLTLSGQLWVKNNSTQQLRFKNDSGTEYLVATHTALTPTNEELLCFDSTTGMMKPTTDMEWNVANDQLLLRGTPYITMQERSSAPSNSGGYGKFWVRNTNPGQGTGTSPIFTDESATDIIMGAQTIILNGRSDVGLTTNTWYTWSTVGAWYDSIWGSAAGGTGTGSSLATCWKYPGLYFPRKAKIWAVDQITHWNDTTVTNPSITWRLSGTSTSDTQAAVGTVYHHTTNTLTFAAAAKMRVQSHTINDSTINAGEMLFLTHRRTTSTAVTVDPYVTLVIKFSWMV